jgi:hypothetical protein
MGNLKEYSLNGEGWTDPPFYVADGHLPIFIFVTGMWVGKITIQVKINGEWEDSNDPPRLVNFDTGAIRLPIGSYIRLGFKVGDYESGTAVIRITK